MSGLALATALEKVRAENADLRASLAEAEHERNLWQKQGTAWETVARHMEAERDAALKDVAALREVLGDLMRENVTHIGTAWSIASRAIASPHPGAEWFASRLREVAERVALYTGEHCGSWDEAEIRRLIFPALDELMNP